MPPWLASADEYDRVVAELIAMDAIEDATFIYWYVRPSARYPTLEFRPCDVCVDIDATVAVAGLVRALAWTARRDVIEDRPAPDMGWEALTAAMWRAARYGLDDQLVSPSARGPRPASDVVDEFLEHVAGGLAVHGDDEEVPALVGQILREGNGAHRQRMARAGDGNLRTTVHAVTVGTVDDPPAPVPTAADVEGPTHGFDVRVELSDLPNSLAQVAAAVGQLKVNILDIHVHEIDGAVVDHILVEAPAGTTADAIRAAVIAAGALQADVAPLSDDLDHDLGVRALEAAIRLVEHRSLAEVVECVGDVVPSDQASLEPIATLPVLDEDRTRLALGIPVSTSLPDATGGHHRAIVPRVGLGDIPFDALVVLRRSAPFSVSEVARLRALLRLHASSAVEP
jgi:hypothetical protein